jgi:hypothetical protein
MESLLSKEHSSKAPRKAQAVGFLRIGAPAQADPLKRNLGKIVVLAQEADQIALIEKVGPTSAIDWLVEFIRQKTTPINRRRRYLNTLSTRN